MVFGKRRKLSTGNPEHGLNGRPKRAQSVSVQEGAPIAVIGAGTGLGRHGKASAGPAEVSFLVVLAEKSMGFDSWFTWWLNHLPIHLFALKGHQWLGASSFPESVHLVFVGLKGSQKDKHFGGSVKKDPVEPK